MASLLADAFDAEGMREWRPVCGDGVRCRSCAVTGYLGYQLRG